MRSDGEGVEVMEKERSLVLIKPDAVDRGLIGRITARFEDKGLRLVALKLMHMDEKLAKTHYAAHTEKGFFDSLISYITSGPVVAMIWEGQNAIEIIRCLMGDTDPQQAKPGTVRGDMGVEITHNLVHGSDSPESAEREIDLFFDGDEIVTYERSVDRWFF